MSLSDILLCVLTSLPLKVFQLLKFFTSKEYDIIRKLIHIDMLTTIGEGSLFNEAQQRSGGSGCHKQLELLIPAGVTITAS